MTAPVQNLPLPEKPSANGATPKRRLLIVDDHPVVRHGLNVLLSELPDVEICGEAGDARSALDAMRRGKPDLAVVDISLPGTNGIELIKLMVAEQPHLLILSVSMHDEMMYGLRALRAGARGYVMKRDATGSIVDAVRKVLKGEIYVSPQLGDRLVFKAIRGADTDLGLPVDKLSDRELEVFQHLGKQHSTREIATVLNLSVKTIETHRMHIKEKLGFSTSEELVRFAVEWLAATEG